MYCNKNKYYDEMALEKDTSADDLYSPGVKLSVLI